MREYDTSHGTIVTRALCATAGIAIAAAIAMLAGPAHGQPDAEPKRLDDEYPGLASGALTYAIPIEMEKGVLLRSGGIVVRQEDLDREIAGYPPYMRADVQADPFFALEEMATEKLLLAETKAAPTTAEPAEPQDGDAAIINKYLQSLTRDVSVSDEEIKAFYEDNQDKIGGVRFSSVSDAIKRFLLEEKRQQAIAAHIENMGRRRRIQVHSGWARAQYKVVKNNVLNRALRKDKPALVAFGGAGCCGPDMTQALMETIEYRYGDQLEVLYLLAEDEWCLAARCEVRSIPTLILYDATGREVARQVGSIREEGVAAMLEEGGLQQEGFLLKEKVRR